MISKVEIRVRELDQGHSDKDFGTFKIKKEEGELEIRKIKDGYVLLKTGYYFYEIKVAELLAAINAIIAYGEPVKINNKKKSLNKKN